MAGRRLAAAAVLGLTGPAQPTSPPPAITDVHAVTLHGGVNRIPGFLPDGGAATIVQAWLDNGNAHGHFAWMVLGDPDRYGSAPLVEWQGNTPETSGDITGASPFDGERVTSDVRFATARIGRARVSLAIRGDLDEAPSHVIADHATATIRWFKLVHNGEGVGDAPDAFVAIGSVRTAKRYCNVDLALRDTAGVPLPRDFAGANRVDGCFAGG